MGFQTNLNDYIVSVFRGTAFMEKGVLNYAVKGLAYQETLVAQWLERPTVIWEAMGSIPVWDSDFFFVPRT